jgi:RNA polymerase sigma-70 factor, ECF subfamily
MPISRLTGRAGCCTAKGSNVNRTTLDCPALERPALDCLVLEHLPAALRFATRLSGNPETAEDIVQDALLRVARSWQTYRGEASFRTWFLRVVVNAFRDRLSRRAVPEELSEELPDERATDPVIVAEDAELGSLVAAAVSTLPPKQREVLVLHTYEQLGTAEVARVLNISEQNVRAQLSYARARLKLALARYRLERP